MQQGEKLLKEYSDAEKGAYLSAIASIATADRSASAEELAFLDALADSADVSPQGKANVQQAAKSLSEAELKSSLDILKGSELRFSLLTDLISFAESDRNYSAEERAHIEKMAAYLNINPQQLATINQFVQKTTAAGASPEQVQQQGFLGSLGLENQFKGAGLNMGSLTKGLLGMSGHVVLADLVRKHLGGSGGLGGMLGGMLGGRTGTGNSGGTTTTNTGKGGGGLGSLISMINGG